MQLAPRDSGKADAFFEPWTCAGNETASAFVADISAMLASAEPPRTRKRRPGDQRTWERTSEAIICELALACIAPPPSGSLVLPLKASHWAQSSRYARHGIGRRTLLSALDAADGLICHVAKGQRTGSATTITPTAEFAREVASRCLVGADFGRRAGEELIKLTRKERKEAPKGVNAPPRIIRHEIEYRDTPTTRRYRAEVAALNEFLERAPIAFLDDGLGPVNTSKRFLTRRFSLLPGQNTPRFDQGGRLFGGFWQDLERERRRSSLYVGGEKAVEVDFDALYPRLACLRAGAPLKGGSALYDLPGLEQHRRGAKLATNALIWRPSLTRFPEEIAKELSKGWGVARMREAIARHTPALEQFITPSPEQEPIGHALMFLESEILMRVMSECVRRELWALPLHDAGITAGSRADELGEVLQAAAEEVVGVALPVSVKAAAGR